MIAGTSISVRTIQDFAQAGYSIAEIVEQYPSLTADDIRAAMHFKAVA